MPFQIIRNDITKVSADAIVNTANPRPCIGSGTDSAIYTAAGAEALLAQRKAIGDIAPGQAVSTDAFALHARYIIHTVGPIWVDGQQGEREVLRACYANALALAAKLGCESVAFPLISSGVYSFPRDEALRIAFSEIGGFLLQHEMRVFLVVLDRKAVELSQRLMGGIAEYIDEQTARSIREAEYRSGYRMSRSRTESVLLERRRRLPMERAPEDSLESVLSKPGDTFQQRLFRLIDQSGMDDVTVYKKANIDRKVFSSIRCKPNYKPKKRTALAFAIALKLDLPATVDLLARAELSFSPSNRFDLIVAYFIRQGNYNIYEINAALFQYGEPTLGCEA